MKYAHIKHLFFDLDHTLWDFYSNSTEALLEVFHHFDLPQKAAINFKKFKAIYDRHNDACWELYRKNLIRKEDLRHVRFNNTLQEIGIRSASNRLAQNMGDLYLAVSPEKTKLIDGALPVLAYLQQRYQLHIITNGFEEVQLQKIETSGLQPYFSHIITSEKAGKRKPDAAIFNYALHSSGAQPNESAMIGDDFEADIMGALHMGLQPIWYAPEMMPTSSEQIQHIVHLQQLTDFF